MINFLKAIIKPSYWLTHQHPVPEFWVYFLGALFGLILILAIVSFFLSMKRIYMKPVRTLFAKLSGWAWFASIFGFFLLFCSVQQVGYLSARIFYIIWFIVSAIWLSSVIKYGIKDVPMRIQQRKEKEEREKYLPKKKK